MELKLIGAHISMQWRTEESRYAGDEELIRIVGNVRR